MNFGVFFIAVLVRLESHGFGAPLSYVGTRPELIDLIYREWGEIKTRWGVEPINNKKLQKLINATAVKVNALDAQMQEEDDPTQHAYNVAMRAMDEKIEAALKRAKVPVKQGVYIRYGCYGEDENEIPVDNLDDIAAEGEVVLVRQADSWIDDAYKSRVIKNPTWLQVCVLAEKMIRHTGDKHHVFLEAITFMPKETKARGDKVKVYEFSMGS